MTTLYKGTIIEESLIDNRLINDLNIIKLRISKDENPADRWHIYTASIAKDEILRLPKIIKPKWYMHFWQGDSIIVIFQGKTFEFNRQDKTSWSPAIEYGISIGIPQEQLDFPTEE